jgi:hypothetical protein
MYRKYLLACTIGVLSMGLLSPVSAATEYVGQADLDRVNQEIQASNYRYCPGYWTGRGAEEEGRSEAYQWLTRLELLGDRPRGAYSRYNVPFKGKTVSLTLPYESNWTLGGKQIRPYLMTGNATIEVGQLDFIDSAVQDYTCSFGRRYKVVVEKGTIQSKTKALQQEVKALKIAGSQADESQDLPTVALGSSLALVPHVIRNSGGFSLQYDQVVVNLTGGWVMTVSSKGGYNATIDPVMLRIAASAR